jgi:hypothetical protein
LGPVDIVVGVDKDKGRDGFWVDDEEAFTSGHLGLPIVMNQVDSRLATVILARDVTLYTPRDLRTRCMRLLNVHSVCVVVVTAQNF